MKADQGLVAALRRLGHERAEADAKTIGAYLSVQRGQVPDDELIRLAVTEIGNAKSFRREGVNSVRKTIPGLVWEGVDDPIGKWSILLSYPVREGLRPLAVQAPIPKSGQAILMSMSVTGDPTLDIDDLVSIAASIRERVDAAAVPLVEEIQAAIETDLSDFEGDERDVYLKTLGNRFAKRPFPFEGSLGRVVRSSVGKARADALADAVKQSEERRLRESVDIGNYVARYAKARSLGRRIVFHVGPTNSGKTYAALQELAKAPRGVYLAPLRLLALENYEALKGMGLAAGMVTGEEEIEVLGASHLSQTVETLDVHREVDVAVIDEIQMISDDDRGWAWTNALFGVPARTVIVCGAEEALGRVQAAAEAAGEELEIVRFQRKSPLNVQNGDIRFKDIRAGDAVVAFSRRVVHEIRLRVIAEGHSVATVYGALSPEVRRAEAARFRSGEADVLVTTDAIGMGLNLGPLRRVVFADIVKWDGAQERELTNAEIRQIAGRAGRYGFHDAGEVGTMVPGGADKVRRALGKRGDAGGRRFFVRPDADAIRLVADQIRSDRLAEVLGRFAADTFYRGSPFMPSNMEETIATATMLDRIAMSLEDRFVFSICPVDRKDREALTSLRTWASLHAAGRPVPAPSVSPYGYLGLIEAGVRLASAYLWLARRFPATFDDVEGAQAARTAGNEAIEAELRNTAVARVARRAKG